MSTSYHAQFQENQRKKIWNGSFTKPKATAGGQVPSAQRSTTVAKQRIRSDTFTLPTKREETSLKVSNVNQAQNASRRQPTTTKSAVVNSLPSPVEQKRTIPMRRSGQLQSPIKQVNSMTNSQRKPVRFANNENNNHNPHYYPPSSPPAYYPKSAPLADPLPQDQFDKPRRMHRPSDDYIVHRRRDSPAYAYTDYQTVSNRIPTTSYITSLPPISQSANPAGPTVIIRPKETLPSNPPTVFIHAKENNYTRPPTVIPSYPSSAPMMMLPSSAPPTSSMFLPNPTMFLPNQPPAQTFFLQSPYMSQPLFYPMPLPKPNPPSAPPPPPPQQTFISQSSSSAVSVPTTIRTENKTEENHATIVVHPNSAKSSSKNVTIQLKMLDEDQPSPQRVVRVVRQPDDVYYVEPEPQRVIYEQPRHRTSVIRRPPPPPVHEYVYVDEYRRPRPRSEVVYVDEERPLAYQDEIVYVDDHNNEIEYIYDEPVYHRPTSKPFRQPSSLTNIVYQ